MCSVIDDEISVNEITASAFIVSLKDAVCRRCQVAKAQTVLRKTDPYCSDCFLKYAIHKFRSTIGKTRMVKPNESVVLAFSGGLSSSCMIQLVKQGLEVSQSHNMRMIFKPILLYIEEGAVLDLPIEERKLAVEFVLEYAKRTCLDVYVCHLEYSLASDFNEVKLSLNSYNEETSAYKTKLTKLFDSVQSLTAKEDLLCRLKRRLLTFAALQLNRNKVFLGSNATRLSGELLSSISQGRGAHIAQEIGFADLRDQIVFLRPMRELIDKEVAYLAHFLKVDSMSTPTLSSKLIPTASIGRLTEQFVLTLQDSFPATITTLFRIGDKMKSNVETASTPELNKSAVCLLCHSIIEKSSDCSAYSARKISRTISRSKPDEKNNPLENASQQPNSCNPDCLSKSCCKLSLVGNDIADWSSVLCYGCRLTVEEVKEPELLPINLLEERRIRNNRQQMQDSIQQFLL